MCTKLPGLRKTIIPGNLLRTIRRLTNSGGSQTKNLLADSSHDVHHAMVVAEGYSKPTKCGEYQCFSGVMGMSDNSFLST